MWRFFSQGNFKSSSDQFRSSKNLTSLSLEISNCSIIFLSLSKGSTPSLPMKSTQWGGELSLEVLNSMVLALSSSKACSATVPTGATTATTFFSYSGLGLTAFSSFTIVSFTPSVTPHSKSLSWFSAHCILLPLQ